ncbi:MAG: 50S ribosomal protein L25 [Anaerolineae bacterium]
MSNDEMIGLKTAERTARGKRVNQARRKGLVPGVVYGPNFEQVLVEVDARELRQVLIAAGGTQIVELQFDDGRAEPTLVRDVQRNPMRGDVLHIDFYRVNLNEPVVNDVPIIIVGEAPLMVSGEAIANQLLTVMSVEALPMEIPQQIEVDVSGRNEFGQVYTIADLVLPENVRAVTEGDEAIVKLDYAVTQVEEEEDELDDLLIEESAEVEVITARSEEEEE